MPSSMPILHQSLQFIDVTVLLFAGLLVSGSDCPLSCLYCSCRFNSLIVTVLNSTGFQQVTGSDCPSYRPIIHQSLHLIGFYSSSFRKFASTGGLRLPSSMPILQLSLQFIDCYSPSLRRFASTGGLRLPSFMPILHQSLQFIDCYSPSLRRFSQVSGSDCSLTDLLYIIASSYWFLQFFASQVCKYRVQVVPSLRPIG